MKHIFDVLKKYRLTERSLQKKLFSLKSEKLSEFVLEMIATISLEKDAQRDSRFNFVANNALSGAPFPCHGMDCRLVNIDGLARNSILFADTVFINNPFERYVHVQEFTENIRSELGMDLLLLSYIKPLLQENIFQFASSRFHLCRSCMEKANLFSKEVSKKMRKNEKAISNFVLNEFSYRIDFNKQNLPYIIIEGVEEFVGHDITITLFNEPLERLKTRLTTNNKLKLTPKEAFDFGLDEFFTSNIVDDLLTQSYYSRYYNSHYLTNRTLDNQLMLQNQKRSNKNFAGSVLSSLSHNLPYLPKTSFQKLINLRKKEGEAFQQYRNSFVKFLSTINEGEQSLKQAFDEEIQPEIDKMNQSIKSSKKLIISDLTKDLVVGSTFVSVGLFSSILPSDISGVISAIGGVNYLEKFGTNANKYINREEAIKDNKYYFLWKTMKV